VCEAEAPDHTARPKKPIAELAGAGLLIAVWLGVPLDEGLGAVTSFRTVTAQVVLCGHDRRVQLSKRAYRVDPESAFTTRGDWPARCKFKLKYPVVVEEGSAYATVGGVSWLSSWFVASIFHSETVSAPPVPLVTPPVRLIVKLARR
jgi:hypothetical protein